MKVIRTNWMDRDEEVVWDVVQFYPSTSGGFMWQSTRPRALLKDPKTGKFDDADIWDLKIIEE